jgi:hypothetical protein
VVEETGVHGENHRPWEKATIVDFVVNRVGSLVPLNMIFQMNQDVYQMAIRIVATFIIVLLLNCTVIDFQEMFTISEYLSLLPF